MYYGTFLEFYVKDRRAPVDLFNGSVGDLPVSTKLSGHLLEGDTYCLNRLTCNLLEFLRTCVEAGLFNRHTSGCDGWPDFLQHPMERVRSSTAAMVSTTI